MLSGTDVAIIGGGVIGCAIAYYLRKAQVEVTVFEQGRVGGQASSAAAGLLAPLGPLSGPGPLADLVMAGFTQLRSLVPELEAESDLALMQYPQTDRMSEGDQSKPNWPCGCTLGYEQTGALRIVRNPKRIERLRQRLEAWRPLGLKMEWLSGEEARKIEPALTPDVCAAVYAPEESQIVAGRVVDAFAALATRAGARIIPHCAIVGLETRGARITGVRTVRDERVACRTLVIASGAWAARCTAWLERLVPISPLHGQLLAFPQLRSPLRSIVFGEGAYLIPRGECILVGATRDERGFDMQVTEEGIARLCDVAGRLVPSLAAVEHQAAWAGLRPRTPDSRPLLGHLPGWENAIIAAGHNSIGIILSAITGKCIADLIQRGYLSPLIAPFTPERFCSPSM